MGLAGLGDSQAHGPDCARNPAKGVHGLDVRQQGCVGDMGSPFLCVSCFALLVCKVAAGADVQYFAAQCDSLALKLA